VATGCDALVVNKIRRVIQTEVTWCYGKKRYVLSCLQKLILESTVQICDGSEFQIEGPLLQKMLCWQFCVSPWENKVATNRETRHRASTTMYSLTFCVRFLLPERHQWKPAVQTASVMLRTPPLGCRSPAGRRRPLPVCSARFWGALPSPASRRPAARADPAQPAVCAMS